MARARVKNTGKPRAGNDYHRCDKCGQSITEGQKRYEWSFRYGGTYTRHVSCGAPRQSETTQGNISQLYAAGEDVEDAVAVDEPTEVDDFEGWRDGIAEALTQAAETARELGSEYEAAAEPFGGQGANQERYEACDGWADELEDAASTVSGVEVQPVDDPDDDPLADAIQEVRDAAESPSLQL